MRILWFLPCLCFSASWGGKRMTEKCNINKYSKWCIGKSRGVFTQLKLLAIQLRRNKQTPKLLFSYSLALIFRASQDQSKGFLWLKVRYSHVPPWCRCRSWCFPEAAQHAAWTESWLCQELVWSALHSCCREVVFVTLKHSYKPVHSTHVHYYFQWLLCHCDQAHVVFGVAARFGVANDVDRVLLSLKPCWQEVSISHVLTVVHTGKEKSEAV